MIEHGRSGIIVDDYRQMAAALEEADALDPLECRRYVEERFAPERMVADYVAALGGAIGVVITRLRVASRRAHLAARPGDPPPRRSPRARWALAAEPTFVLVDTAIVGHLGRRSSRRSGLPASSLGGVFAIFNFLAYGTTRR